MLIYVLSKTMRLQLKKFWKKIFSLIFIIIVALLIFWLWQRQPRPVKIETSPEEASLSGKPAEKEPNWLTKPKDNQILAATLVDFQGQTTPGSFIIVYANTLQEVIKADRTGTFGKTIELPQGLNLINVIALSSKLEQEQRAQLTLFVQEKDSIGQTVFAGSVKSIFDTLITITTPAGDRHIRTTKSTDFQFPAEDQDATPSAKSVRIGDFAIAQGDTSDPDTLLARRVEIIRLDKPTISEELVVSTILTSVRQNIFSIRDSANQIVELTLDNNSQISEDGKETTKTQIVKDKKALILYNQEEDKKIVDLIYLPP